MLVSGVTKKGGRPVNEDAWGEVNAGGIECVVVADGLGGHNGGSIASGAAVEAVIRSFKSEPKFSADTLKKLVEEANGAVMAKAETEPTLVHMSTTIAILLIKGRNAMWATVGDTRIYLFEDNMIAEVTEDQSLAFADFISGEIEYDDIRHSDKQNKLTNALGAAFGKADISEPVRVDSRAAFLVCTDGWWEHVREPQMEETLKGAYTTHDWLSEMLSIREEAAPENSDNFTAAAVML
ncbi:MAG: serine/threonine-protein phosphatase [Clostridia bacterium]|nr:serine/threonine-protein phosphatase [Clostridia bacterium]